MKKWWLSAIVGLTLVLGACSSDFNSPDKKIKKETETNSAIERESVDKEVIEDGNSDSDAEEYNEETGEGYIEGIGYVKTIGVGYNAEFGIDGTDAPLKPLEMGDMNFGVENLFVLEVEPDEDAKELYFDEKDKMKVIVMNMNAENTSEVDITFNPNYSTIVTNTGEQLEPLMFLSGEAGGDFLGKVKKEGQTWWMLDKMDGDITNVKMIIHPPYRTDDSEDISDEKRVEFEVLTFEDALKRDSSEE